MAAKPAGSIWAAQPVTTMRASGFSRRALRIAWRAWRVASAVTAQVLITTASAEPGRGGMAAHDLGLEGVEPAAEGDELDHGMTWSWTRAAAAPRGSSPVKLIATGPVMRT